MGSSRWRWYVVRLVCMALFLTLLSLTTGESAGVSAASSFTVTVTTTADTSNACATTGIAPCSLRDATRYASAQMGNGPVTISLPAGNYQQVGWNTCDPVPDNAGAFSIATTAASFHPVSIIGAGAGSTIVHGAGAGNTHYSVFSFGRGDVTLTGMTITNGDADNCSPASGGGIRAAGGSLTLANVIVTGNASRGSGGGISIGGDAHIYNSQITNNISCNGGGIAIGGGSASVIANTTISGNQQGVDPSGLCYGSAGGDAAGMAAGYGVLQVTGSAIINNSSLYTNVNDPSPGGIGVRDAALTITNSTIANNSSGNGTGGIVGSGNVTLTNDTFAGNTGGAGQPQAIDRTISGTYTLTGTIVRGSGMLCSGVASGGYNIASDSSCALTQATDHPATNPVLGTLGDHGGPTSTFDLGSGSPALDAIPAAGCPSSVDQRGVYRPQGAGCDIGAFEAGATPPTLRTVAPSSGSTAGGSSVTLTGVGFTNGTTVTVDAAAVTTTFVNDTTLRITTPAHSPGLVDVTVAVPGVGVATLPRSYLYGDVASLPAPSTPSGPTMGSAPSPMPSSRTPGPGVSGSPAPLPPGPHTGSASRTGSSSTSTTSANPSGTTAPLPGSR